MRSLVVQYGPRAVWRAGIEVLGHPPTWTPSGEDVRRVAAVLAK